MFRQMTYYEKHCMTMMQRIMDGLHWNSMGKYEILSQTIFCQVLRATCFSLLSFPLNCMMFRWDQPTWWNVCNLPKDTIPYH